MLSKSKAKYIRSLGRKKGRLSACAFVAEGPKVVGELLGVLPVRMVLATDGWLRSHPSLGGEVVAVTDDELSQVSFLQHPQEVLAVFPLMDGGSVAANGDWSSVGESLSARLFLALDGIRDPGNLGTIIRIADWFGIDHIVCSPDTADVYNPKVVQATMGSLAHVHIHYLDLAEWLDSLPEDFPVYGTFLDGENIYGQSLSPHGVIVMGNEGSGISPGIAARVSHRLVIPCFAQGRRAAESLNVAIATAITCSEFSRRINLLQEMNH